MSLRYISSFMEQATLSLTLKEMKSTNSFSPIGSRRSMHLDPSLRSTSLGTWKRRFLGLRRNKQQLSRRGKRSFQIRGSKKLKHRQLRRVERDRIIVINKERISKAKVITQMMLGVRTTDSCI